MNMINRVISNAFYYVVDLDPTVVSPDKNGNRLVYKSNEVPLDPGGMLHQRIPWTDFEIDGVKFTIQVHNAEHTHWRISQTREDLEDYTTFVLWKCRVYMPTKLCDALLIRLKEFADSDVAAHAELDARETLMALESDTLDFITCRGRTPEEVEERLKKMGL